MFKFLRKYNKIILAVGGTLLLIVFLIPQALQQLSQRQFTRGTAWATVGDDEKVTMADRAEAQSDLAVLEQISRAGQQFFPMPIRQPDHWYLLVREADQMGLISPLIEVPDMPQIGGGITRDQMRGFLTRAAGVERLLNLYLGSSTYSDTRLKHTGERLLHKVIIRSAVIEPAPERAPEPTDAELQEQFQTYRDVTPGEGEYGFGYRLPDRLKLEWLEIPADDVRARIEESGIDNIAVRKFWSENSGRNNLPPAPQQGTGATLIPDVVREAYLAQRMQERLDEIANFIYNRLRTPQRSVPRRDGYLVLPENWREQQVSFDALAEELRSRFGIERPAVQAIGDRWLASEDITAMPELSAAGTSKFGERLTLPDMFPAFQEFGGNGTIPVQENVALPPLQTLDGSITVVRVTATDPARAPAELADVREEVVRDVKRRAAYEQLVQNRNEIERQAEAQGMLSLALDHDAVVQGPTNVALIDPIMMQIAAMRGMEPLLEPSMIPGVSSSKPIVEAVIDHARSLPHDRLIADLPIEQRILTVPAEDQLALVVVQLLSQTPLTIDEYERMVEQTMLQRILMRGELGDATTFEEAFGYDALAKRHQFKLMQTTEADGDAAETGETEATEERG